VGSIRALAASMKLIEAHPAFLCVGVKKRRKRRHLGRKELHYNNNNE
jgi:hypothetical protein